MRIYFDNCDFSSRSGPNSFASRLAKEMFNMGHEVVDHTNYDTALVFIEATSKLNLSKPFVQRLDGIWISPNDFNSGKNRNIHQTYVHANSVVFQSEFNHQQITSLWGNPKKWEIIHNGIDINEAHKQAQRGLSRADLSQLRQQYDTFYVCSANWHPQKRLSDNIRLFNHIKSITPNNKSCLIVMGNNPDHLVSSPDVFYTGNLDHEQCLAIYAQCNWMLHLAFLDHCPNTVVECLSVGTPVICTDLGGTQELVKDFGIILKDSSTYHGGTVEYDKPPQIDVTQLQIIPDKSTLGKCVDIDIKTSAQRYIDVLQNTIII